MFIDNLARANRPNQALSFLRAMVTKLGEKPAKEEVQSLWYLGKDDLGIRRELELCVQPRKFIPPNRRPYAGDAYKGNSRFLPRNLSLQRPPHREAIAGGRDKVY